MDKAHQKVVYLFSRGQRAQNKVNMELEIDQDNNYSQVSSTGSSSKIGQTQSEELVAMHSQAQMKELYTTAQVEKLLDIPLGRLRYWAQSGLVIPTGLRGTKRYYTFQDLVGLRAAKGLLNSGLSTRQIRNALSALNERLPHRRAPLTELRLVTEGKKLIVKEEDQSFEAETGQLLFDFDIKALKKQVVELIQPNRAPEIDQLQQAFDLYIEGCRHEATPQGITQAEDCYRQAIEKDPKLGCAYTNLGNIRYRASAIDDARAFYTKAMELEPNQPEACYNLAFLNYEEGEFQQAVKLFQKALELDPDFADAHFNLAVTLTELDNELEASVHYKIYLELEPSGPWAELAKNELNQDI